LQERGQVNWPRDCRETGIESTYDLLYAFEADQSKQTTWRHEKGKMGGMEGDLCGTFHAKE